MPTDNPQVQAQAASARINERVEQGAQRVEQTVHSATNAAIEQVRDVRERAESGLQQQRAMVSSRVRRIGEAIRHTSDQLSREDQFAQGLLDNASERVQRVADYIDQARFENVAQDLHSFARRQPGVFFGSAFLIGLAIGRFAKSSASASVGGGSSQPVYEEDHNEVDLPAPARTQAATRAPGYDLSTGTNQRSSGTPSGTPSSTPSVSSGSPSSSTSASASTSTSASASTGTGASTSSAPSSGSTSGSTGGSTGGSSTSGGQKSTAPGSAFGSNSGAGSSMDSPKPQTSTASTQPRATEPGKGSKS